MNWTDKFIPLPIKLVVSGDTNLGQEDTYVDEEMMVNPCDIVSYNRHSIQHSRKHPLQGSY